MRLHTELKNSISCTIKILIHIISHFTSKINRTIKSDCNITNNQCIITIHPRTKTHKYNLTISSIKE